MNIESIAKSSKKKIKLYLKVRDTIKSGTDGIDHFYFYLIFIKKISFRKNIVKSACEYEPEYDKGGHLFSHTLKKTQKLSIKHIFRFIVKCLNCGLRCIICINIKKLKINCITRSLSLISQ